MKISIAYIPGEEGSAQAVEEAARAVLPGLKVRKSELHPPFKHIYMTTRKPEKPCNIKDNP